MAAAPVLKTIVLALILAAPAAATGARRRTLTIDHLINFAGTAHAVTGPEIAAHVTPQGPLMDQEIVAVRPGHAVKYRVIVVALSEQECFARAVGNALQRNAFRVGI